MPGDEISRRIFRLMFTAPKMTSNVLKSLISPLVTNIKTFKRALTSEKTGEMSLKELRQRGELMDIPISPDNIEDFRHIARKYHLPFALKRYTDKKTHETTESVIFEVMNVNQAYRAFREYTGLLVEKAPEGVKPDNERLDLNEQIDEAHKNEEERQENGTRGDQERDDKEHEGHDNSSHDSVPNRNGYSNSGRSVQYRGPQHREDQSVPPL